MKTGMTIEDYITRVSNGDHVLQRRLRADVTRPGTMVTAGLNDSYKKTIDALLAKMKFKRAPLEGREPVPYAVQAGEHDRKVLSGIDPVDGGKLDRVWINDKREAMFNPSTLAVWPLPVSKTEAIV